MEKLDRISNLPDSLISPILSLLPTKEAVATSVLSTRWNLAWTKVTNLDFNLDKKKEGEEEAVTVRKFVLFVNKVLCLIGSQRLHKFQLRWSLGQRDPEYISLWISYAINQGIRVIVIDLGPRRISVGIHLPGTLFTCATLERLQINAHFVVKVPSVVCLPNLCDVDLRYAFFESSECLPKLISGCPVLSTLTIATDMDNTDMLEFD